MNGHLVKRFLSSLSNRPPDAVDTAWAESFLLDGEVQLWRQFEPPDRRHSIAVARRFASMATWTRDEMAGALLHDIGKLDSGLGTAARVVATVVGPRTDRFRRYHDHEQIGADMLVAAGSSTATIELVRGRGQAAVALVEADHI